MEKGETSNSKQKRKREESWNPHSSWENYENETMNQRGYAKASGKWTKVAEEFKPYYEETKSKKLLNLDCVRNPEDILQRWSNDMIMLIATDEKFSKINLMDIKNLIAYRTTGNVLKFLTSINDETWNQYIGMVENNNQQFAKLIMELIYKEFIGYNTLEHKTEVNKLLREKAEIHLINMQICNMCEIDSFICEYKKYYYELDNETREIYRGVFISKLPYPLSAKIRDIWKSQPID
ncbi:uncharacterized protein LOC131634502 [Vicia villosa]|uniref:uncharacterized protein LOC131634502 n=1 Tax=Vicia villosa TaxID=3911 RepID=UPI00273C5BC5|nr:uncharacterized protein LOC131634502 [Vicia villosa]